MKIKEFGILLIAFLLLSCAETGVDVYAYQSKKTILNENPISYYLDATSGSDTNEGTSSEKAWKSLDRLNEVTFEPGDKILFKKGEIFNGVFEFKGKGTSKQLVVIDAYGEGDEKPCIQGNDDSFYAARIYNSSYLTIQNLKIVNKGKELVGRSGLKIECNNSGIAYNITINNITVCDVNSTFPKPDYGGAILLVCKGKERKTRFENLLIENCHIKDCQRNGIFWGGSGAAYCDRKNWYPSRNVIIRNNLIEGVPGDGILPMACDGVLIEYNVMRDCKPLPNHGAAAGIWPWSCDNVTIQFNEVSGHQATADGQAYDSDYNCRNTVIQYNYSHENYGGFVLICDDPTATYVNSVGILNSKIRYNISINDGIHNDGRGIKSPCIHFIGKAKEPLLEYNIIHASPSVKEEDYTMVRISGGGGWTLDPMFRKNIFYAPQQNDFDLREGTYLFENNWYLGDYKKKPSDTGGQTKSDYYQKKVIDIDPEGYNGLYNLMEKRVVGGQDHYFVKKDAIEAFFREMENSK